MLRTARTLQVSYSFENVEFAVIDPTRHGAVLDGCVIDERMRRAFRLVLLPAPRGRWKLHELTWNPWSIPALEDPAFVQRLVDHAARLLVRTNMWPSDNATGGGAKISFNRGEPSPVISSKVCASWRTELLSLSNANWSKLWQLIEQRVQADAAFSVRGFSRAELLAAMDHLRLVFPAEWVKARFSDGGSTPPMMNAGLSQEAAGWFPASHLARTALGVICVDPAWNYLVEIALAVEELREFAGRDRLVRALATSSGTQHHICLAAELHRRGKLVGLEPPTGDGAYTDDLLVRHGGREYAIEVKEFSSKTPGKRLSREIEQKAKEMPSRPARPVVFHAVLREQGMFEPDREQQFFAAIDALATELPPKISAIVAGRRFVDSAGGRVKRDVQRVVVNASALLPADEADLAAIFEKTYENIVYPLFGVGQFVELARTEQGGAAAGVRTGEAG